MKLLSKYIVPILLLSCSITSCKKYLDVIPAGKQILTTVDDYNKLLNYQSLNSFNSADVTYLSDQCGLNEILGLNGLKQGSWSIPSIEYLGMSNLSRIQYNTSTTSDTYNFPYKIISQCNLIISNAGTMTGDEKKKKQLLAEAKILRAYCHFILVNVYAKAYDAATAQNDNGVVIEKEFNIESAPGPSTVQQVYDYIESDVKDAIPDLELDHPQENAFHPSKAAAYGLLAKLYLFKGQIPESKVAAVQALKLNNYIYDLVNHYTVMNQLDNVDYSLQGSGNENLYFAATSSIDIDATVISREFYNSFDATRDVRKLSFFNTTAVAVGAGSGMAAYVLKVAGTAASATGTLVATGRFYYNANGIKTTDVYLMLAECCARQGNADSAALLVDQIRTKRMLPGFTTAASEMAAVSGDKKIAAVKMVLEERRKELLFGFNRFMDQKRLGKEPDYAITVTRVFPYADKTIAPQTYTIEPNSPLYIAPFPKGILTFNPLMKQNCTDAP